MNANTGSKPPEMCEIGGIGGTLAYSCLSNKDGYFYSQPRPLPQRTRWSTQELGLLGQRMTISPINVLEVRSVVQIDVVVEDFLTDKGKGQRGESGNYRQEVTGRLHTHNSLSNHE